MTSSYLGYETSSEKFLYYVLSDQVNDVIKSGFWVILKSTSGNLCKPIYDVINYSTFICPFESEKCWFDEKIKIW